jgi:hemoglobin
MFEAIGGQEVIDKLVDDFYKIMSSDPRATECWLTHQGKDVSDSAHKLKFFLSGWLGGPQIYLEKFGHPRLKMRHLPFSIGTLEAHQWLYCMNKALEMSNIKEEIQDQMIQAFAGVAMMLRNREEN